MKLSELERVEDRIACARALSVDLSADQFRKRVVCEIEIDPARLSMTISYRKTLYRAGEDTTPWTQQRPLTVDQIEATRGYDWRKTD